MRRVDEAVRAVLSDAIARQLQDPRVGFVTVTGVKTSPDLRHARVYVSVLGDHQAREASLDGLRHAHGFLQSRVASELTLKHTPTLSFEYDESIDRGMRISGLLDEHDRGKPAVSSNGDRASREAVLDELRNAGKLIVVTHENPDGDALGSLIAMQEILTALGKDSVMFIDAKEFPLPYEYRSFALTGLVTTPPADIDERTIVFLDCGNLDRNPADALQRSGARILNIDHHHDNTRFGTVDYVVPEASCTAEIVWDLEKGLGVPPTATIAEALYVGLITDTGRFMYENTGACAHVMAAELIAAGVDVHEIYRRIYEGVPYGKLALLARGLAKIERYDHGRLTLTSLTQQDFLESGAEESYSEGVIDHLRAVNGTAIAALVRDKLSSGSDEQLRKVSLRAGDERVDVSAIARVQGGGGHKQAAGFTTTLSREELVDFLRDQLDKQL